MPPSSIKKLYFSIREVSEATGLKPHVLRYWETEFDALRPKKNRAGNRTYTSRDIDIVERIQRLLREEKYTIEGARAALAKELKGEDDELATPPDARQELRDLRAFLSDVLRGFEGSQ